MNAPRKCTEQGRDYIRWCAISIPMATQLLAWRWRQRFCAVIRFNTENLGDGMQPTSTRTADSRNQTYHVLRHVGFPAHSFTAVRAGAHCRKAKFPISMQLPASTEDTCTNVRTILSGTLDTRPAEYTDRVLPARR